MALRHVVVTTEANYTTRVRDPFRTTAKVTETSSLRLCGEPRWITAMGFIGSTKMSEGGNA
jgi:hypothetical protein